MIRLQTPGRDLASLVDAGIVTVGVAIVGWTFVMQPRLSSDASAFETVVALTFPVMDVLLLSLAARMVLGPGLRSPAFALVTTALVFQLVGDALYGFGSLHGWYRAGDSVDLLFVLSAVFLGHGGAPPLDGAADRTEPGPGAAPDGKRLAVLSAATFMAPAMLVVAAVRAGNGELLVIVGAATTLSALVLVRLAGIVGRHERGERREHAVAQAAAALVVAWTPEDIHRVAVDGALEVVGGDEATVVRRWTARQAPRSWRPPACTPIRCFSAGSTRSPSARACGRSRAGRPERAARDARGPHPKKLRRARATGSTRWPSRLRLPSRARRSRRTCTSARAPSASARSSGTRCDVIALLEPDLTIRYHSPSVERVLGYRARTGSSASCLDGPASSRAEVSACAGSFADCARTPGAEASADLPLSPERRLDVLAGERRQQPARRPANVGGIVVNSRDVTERRRLEASSRTRRSTTR